MRFAFIAKHRHVWPVSWLCEALDVSRSGFHAWLHRARADEDPDGKGGASLVGSARTYGARRVWRDVLAEGVSCGLHKIERLMRANALPGAASASWPAEGRRRPDIRRSAQCPRPAICSRAA
jgi:putative transposase